MQTSQIEPSPQWPLQCKCGEAWTEAEWPELPTIGLYDAGADGWFELRTCVCGATLSIPSAAARAETFRHAVDSSPQRS